MASSVKKYVLKRLFMLAALCWPLTSYAQQEDVTTLFDFQHLLSYGVAALLIGLFVMLFRNRLIFYREREVNDQNRSRNTQLALVLKASRMGVWTYDVATQRYRRLGKDDGVKVEYSPIDFGLAYDRQDFERLRQQVVEIREGRIAQATLSMRGADDGDEEQREYDVNIRVLKSDAHGKPTTIIGMERDMTDMHRKNTESSQMLMRYHTVFNESLIDMVYYDADGVMTDINDKALATFHIPDRQAFLDSKPTIRRNPGYEVAKFCEEDTYRFVTLLDEGDRYDGKGGSMFYEMELGRVYDADGRQTGTFFAGRNVSEMAENHQRQIQATRQMKEATKRIEDYIANINYALQVSEVRIMNYFPQTHLLEISSDLRKTQYRLTQMRCLGLLHPDDQRTARRLLRAMDNWVDKKLVQTLRTILKDRKGRDVYLDFNIMPLYDAEGKVDHYFGMCRNATEQMATDLQLKQETMKARETEELKAAFLMNMSYEIRTPLNAVLGFAELLKDKHDADDEPVFIEQIKSNTNKLLELVNDVLFLSRLDAKMVESPKKTCDVAAIFDAHCHMGWTAHLSEGVRATVECPYNSLMLVIDEEHLEQVINRLCAYAAFNTRKGTIKAKCEYRMGALNITIEDTGEGFSSEELPKLFDRFASDKAGKHWGSGLGLAIVKELVELMGGAIDVSSEKGKGTSVWVSIPCQLIESDRKKDTEE